MVIRHVLTPLTAEAYPLFIETIGLNPRQEEVVRDAGYQYFHWIQTKEGAGIMETEADTFALPAGAGALLLPGTPHRYRSAAGGTWSTLYLTFGGVLAQEIVRLLGLGGRSAPYSWDVKTPLHTRAEEILAEVNADARYSGLRASQAVYRFITELRMYGQSYNRSAVADVMGVLEPLLSHLEERFADSSLGLSRMAGVVGISTRHLHTLFRAAFGLSPYAYLILLRIRKAKTLLLGDPAVTVAQVAERVGFRDASHFVATFRQHVGMTPERFRNYR